MDNINNKIFKSSKWIWAKKSLDVDDYAEFVASFSSNEEVTIRISSDSVYALYINDELIKFMSCSDYEFYKYVDEFKYQPTQLENILKIQVWHFGDGSSNYVNATHGLIFEIFNSSGLLLVSNENIQSRVMNEYKNGYQKKITQQLGFSYYYDNRENKKEFSNSILVDKKCNFVYRNIHPIKLLDRINTTYINKGDSLIVDLGKEWTGLVDLDIDSDADQEVLISFGEHLIDNKVRRFVGNRDFSVEFYLKKGANKILPPFRRIAGRYLQIYYSKPIKINYLGIRPVMYEHEIIHRKFDDSLLNQIYQTCIHTLEMCMHEHYEDCPWREQSLYVLDSRNQMLCGYYAFKGFEFARHNILLLSKSLKKETGLLSLTAPKGDYDYPIPFFSLAFIKSVSEYVTYSGDYSILEEVKDVLSSIVNTFTKHIDGNNLIPYFKKPFWNFYEWTDGNFGEDVFSAKEIIINKYDLTINAAYVYFVDIYNKLYNQKVDTAKVKKAIKDRFYDEKTGLYFADSLNNRYSQLSLAFTSLIGLSNKEIEKELLKADKSTEASLSTRGFVYDALLDSNSGYKDEIIKDIKNRYKAMLDQGATTFFETEEGASAFGNAGSLCHGWSAMPIYYLNLLIK